MENFYENKWITIVLEFQHKFIWIVELDRYGNPDFFVKSLSISCTRIMVKVCCVKFIEPIFRQPKRMHNLFERYFLQRFVAQEKVL